jgi:hypothetical protein
MKSRNINTRDIACMKGRETPTRMYLGNLNGRDYLGYISVGRVI